MLADAAEGRFDLILTKSVSRFARNTAIVLEATRALRRMKVGVFFELQKINTLSGEGELMLTILSAFAQAESEDLRAQQMETLVSEGPVTCCSPALIQRILMM